ncbi:MAG: hypothetical protein WD691_06245 [Acidimicrobiales bacterium]
MRIGIFGGAASGSGNVDKVVNSAHLAATEGFGSFWLPQIFSTGLTDLLVVELGSADELHRTREFLRGLL